MVTGPAGAGTAAGAAVAAVVGWVRVTGDAMTVGAAVTALVWGAAGTADVAGADVGTVTGTVGEEVAAGEARCTVGPVDFFEPTSAPMTTRATSTPAARATARRRPRPGGVLPAIGIGDPDGRCIGLATRRRRPPMLPEIHTGVPGILVPILTTVLRRSKSDEACQPHVTRQHGSK